MEVSAGGRHRGQELVDLQYTSQFRWQQIRLAQHATGDAQLFRHQRIDIGLERAAGPREMVELTARNRLLDPALDQRRQRGRSTEKHRMMLTQRLSAAIFRSELRPATFVQCRGVEQTQLAPSAGPRK